MDNDQNGFLIPTIWGQDLPAFLRENMGILDPSLAKLYLSQTVAVDMDHLQNAIKTIYTNKILREKMGSESLKKAQRFQWGKIIKDYEDFWAELGEEATTSDSSIFGTDMDMLIGDFEKAFSHYPAKILSNNDRVSITQVGRNVLSKNSDLITYEDMSVCLFPELETLILNSLMNNDLNVLDIKIEAEKTLQATSGDTTFHLSHLLKHGAITLRQGDLK